jgi:hypothetical protein
MGGVFGASLAKAGHDVVFVDTINSAIVEAPCFCRWPLGGRGAAAAIHQEWE